MDLMEKVLFAKKNRDFLLQCIAEKLHDEENAQRICDAVRGFLRKMFKDEMQFDIAIAIAVLSDQILAECIEFDKDEKKEDYNVN
jgi:hypothetical protein